MKRRKTSNMVEISMKLKKKKKICDVPKIIFSWKITCHFLWCSAIIIKLWLLSHGTLMTIITKLSFVYCHYIKFEVPKQSLQTWIGLKNSNKIFCTTPATDKLDFWTSLMISYLSALISREWGQVKVCNYNLTLLKPIQLWMSDCN